MASYDLVVRSQGSGRSVTEVGTMSLYIWDGMTIGDIQAAADNGNQGAQRYLERMGLGD